jgi:predicted metal-binding membrane protein
MPTGLAHAETDRRPPILRALARPRALALGCIAVLVAAGWLYLGLVLAGRTSGGILAALCQPLTGTAGSLGVTAALLTFIMWCAMALAMMLPTAGPMIMTYADLAETAAAKGEPAASPLALTAGYVSVWLGAALVLAALQAGLMRAGLLDDAMSVASPLFAGAIFLLAGFYQFSAMKHACITQCQHPFRFFFANWTSDVRGVFRLGFRQGLYCFGCCWAMMLLMFAVGVMNVLWMAALGAIMAAEKLFHTTRFSHALGAIFCAIGFIVIAASVVAHWPKA